jgi:hypothetical protein
MILRDRAGSSTQPSRFDGRDRSTRNNGYAGRDPCPGQPTVVTTAGEPGRRAPQLPIARLGPDLQLRGRDSNSQPHG